ncbi:MAG: ROK family protein [Candidatus Omnitrophota bacterium]
MNKAKSLQAPSSKKISLTGFVIGIDIGGTNIKVGLINKDKIIHKFVLKTSLYPKKSDLIKAVFSSIDKVLRNNCLEKKDILGIGIGLPGAIDYKRGIVHYLPNIPGWKDVPLARLIRNHLGISTYIDNDVNLMALAELYYGQGRGKKNLVCITLGTGVGGGLIIEGNIYRGTSFSAGEIGHMPIELKGAFCNCGSHGCLESLIGNSRILGRAKKVFGKYITLEELSNLAIKGNQRAVKIWQDTGFILGTVLAGVVNLLNPELIIIGGGVSESGKILFNQVRETIKERAMPLPGSIIQVRKAVVREPGIMGAAVLVRNSLKLKYS